MINFESLIRKLIDSGVAKRSEIIGCTEAEVQGLESEVGGRLPDAYRRFLLCMGHSAGHFYLGTDIFFRHVRGNLTKAANRLLAKDGRSPLPKNAFVFGMHQGYQFTFFLLGQGEDPAVEGYLEKGEFYKVSDSLSPFWTEGAEDTIRAEQRLGERRKMVAAKREKLPPLN